MSSLRLWGIQVRDHLGEYGGLKQLHHWNAPLTKGAGMGKLYGLQVAGLVCEFLICNLGDGLLNLKSSFYKHRISPNSLSLLSLFPPSRKECCSLEEIAKQLNCANWTGEKLKLAKLRTLKRHFAMRSRRQCYRLKPAWLKGLGVKLRVLSLALLGCGDGS